MSTQFPDDMPYHALPSLPDSLNEIVTYSYGDVVKDVSKTITVGTTAVDTSKGDKPSNTTAVKTGDETYALTFVSLMMLTACGYTYLRRKEL